MTTPILTSLEELASSWDSLAVGSGSPLHHYAWISTCAQSFASPADLRIVVVGSPQRPAAIAPLVIRSGATRRLELFGLRELHEPLDLIYQDADAVASLADAVTALGLPVLLERVPAESATLAAMRQAVRGRGVVVCRPALGCPSLSLDDRWAEREPPIKSGRRSDLRRARRRAERLGPITADVVAPKPLELAGLLDLVYRVESAGWKGERRTALAYDAIRGPFYRAYAAAACDRGILRLCFLRIGDAVAACQIALESEKGFWLLKIGYDAAFAHCSPGMLLIGETIRYAATRRLRSYEFLGTPEPWIRMWTEFTLPRVSVRVYPAGPLAAITFTRDVAWAAWLRFKRLLGRPP